MKIKFTAIGSNGSNCSEGVSNTKTPSKRIPACKNWCFTLNNWTDEEYLSLRDFLKNGSKFIIGKEIGENGTPHLQGWVEFDTKLRPLETKELCKRIHWEKQYSSNEDCINYCAKDGDYIVNRCVVKKPLKLIKDSQLYNWQKEIIEIIKKEPDDRHIYWFWEPIGKIGKTQFSKYLSYWYNAIPILGKKTDCLFVASEYDAPIYIFNYPRDMENSVNYNVLETLKDGYYMVGKYEGKPVIRNPPHIIIFANWPPNMEKLSKDRWKVTEIKKEIA